MSFEFAPTDAGLFGELTAELRASPERGFGDREAEIRLSWTG